jgi:hypothetical protein
MLTIFGSIRKEFSVNDKGITYTSKRGLSRLCGVQSNTWSKKLFLFSKELDLFICEELEIDCSVHQNNVNNRDFLLKVLSDKGFLVVTKSSFEVQDILASLVIEFYASVKKVPQAKETNRALRAIGLRSAIQDATGWNKPKKEYGNILLHTPRVHSKVFADEFYDELSRLTGLEWDRKTHQRPCIFAQLTYDLVYSHLPKEVYLQIKKTQKEHGGYIHKMHQFLNQDGLGILLDHLELTLNILTAVSSIDSAKQLVNQSVTGVYQQTLFSN